MSITVPVTSRDKGDAMQHKDYIYDDEFKLTFKDYVALVIAAFQIVTPYVIGFLSLFVLCVYLLMVYWLQQ